MAIVEKTAATLQQVLGPQIEELGRTTGVIQRHRKFSAVSLLRMLVLTLLRKPAAKPTDFQATAAQLGLEVTAAAVEHRFNGRLVVFLRAVLERVVERALAAAPQPIELLKKFTSVRLGDSSTLALPAELADQFPGCGGTLHTGAAAPEDPPAVGLSHRLDPPPGNHPRPRQRRDQPDRPGCLRPDRCRCSTWATSPWTGWGT